MKLINKIAKAHFDWVESKSWHNKSPLESIALIGSEIGEAVQEVFNKNDSLRDLEIADIYLRCIDLAVENNIDLDENRKKQITHYHNFNVSNYGYHVVQHLAYLTVPLAKLANTTRHEKLPKEFSETLINFMLEIEKISVYNHIDLINNVAEKIEINLTKDHKDRIR